LFILHIFFKKVLPFCFGFFFHSIYQKSIKKQKKKKNRHKNNNNDC